MLSSFFKCSIQAADVNDVAAAKKFLMTHCGLIASQAEDELFELQNCEAALLCYFYEQGLRGANLRELKNAVATKIIAKVLCGDDGNLDRAFLDLLNTQFQRYAISTIDKLFLFLLASRRDHHDDSKTRDELREIGWNALAILAGMTECHDMMIFVALLKREDLEPQQALDKLYSDDLQVVEMRAIESPATRCNI